MVDFFRLQGKRTIVDAGKNTPPHPVVLVLIVLIKKQLELDAADAQFFPQLPFRRFIR